MADNLNWRGPWSGGTTYQINDIVYYEGSSFVALIVNINTPPTTLYIGTTWGILALEGTQGLQGPQGVQGVQGVPGIPGSQGARGVQGIRGNTGPQGTPGAPGAAGVQGMQGVQGARGVPGSAGIAGVQGIQGPRGLPGAAGVDGRGFNWRGIWQRNYVYQEYDALFYNGSSYVCLTSNVINVPPDSDINKWNLLASSNNSLPQVNADWDATSGVAEIFNKPILGTAAAQDTTAFDSAGSAATVQINLNAEIIRAEAIEATKTSTVMAIAYAVALGG